MDGSAGPFVFLLQSAGIEEQRHPKRFMRVKKRLRVEDGDKWAQFDPFDGFKVNFEIEFQPSNLQAVAHSARRWISRPLVPQGGEPGAHLRLRARSRGRCARQPCLGEVSTTRSCSMTSAC